MSLRTLLIFSALGLVNACTSQRENPARARDTIPSSSGGTTQAGAPAEVWTVRALRYAPRRFRPGGWSNEKVLWGRVRDRVTSLDVQTGAIETLRATAWSLHTGLDVVSWRNERGTWYLRGRGEPVRIAGPEGDPHTGFDGPPTILWSRDGTRALIGWQGEWDTQYKSLERDGSQRRLQTRLPGYFANTARLWLDSTRVLFETVANAPVGGAPTYRESGWRGDLAVLDLRTMTYARVTNVSDFTYLRVAGPYGDGVMVTEWDTSGARGHVVYDSRTWERRATALPKGRAFSSAAGGGRVSQRAGRQRGRCAAG